MQHSLNDQGLVAAKRRAQMTGLDNTTGDLALLSYRNTVPAEESPWCRPIWQINFGQHPTGKTKENMFHFDKWSLKLIRGNDYTVLDFNGSIR